MIVMNIYSHYQATDNDIDDDDDDDDDVDQILKDRMYNQKVAVILSVESVCQLS